MTGLRVLRDLRTGFGSVRDQGARPTCLAFAASDAHAAARGGPWGALSAEWAYYHAVKRDGGDITSGSTLDGMLDALRLDGQPVEEVWPYRDDDPTDLGAWMLPSGSPELFRRAGRREAAAVPDVLALIDGGSPTLLVMTLSGAFFAPDADGVVASAEAPDPALVHAVVAVGHGVLADGAAGILVRNSWGDEWGLDGHAWLAEGYLAPRLRSCVVMAEEV